MQTAVNATRFVVVGMYYEMRMYVPTYETKFKAIHSCKFQKGKGKHDSPQIGIITSISATAIIRTYKTDCHIYLKVYAVRT